jgi:hypothetical protein
MAITPSSSFSLRIHGNMLLLFAAKDMSMLELSKKLLFKLVLKAVAQLLL